MEEAVKKPYAIMGSNSVLTKYRMCDKDVTVYLTNGEEFTGRLRWFDDYALKVILSDGSGSITIPLHNVISYDCEHFLLENEVEKTTKVFRGTPKCTDKERTQLFRYKKNKELVEFHLVDGIKIKGIIKWYVDHIYCITSGEDEKDYLITKRHIFYYRKIESQKPERTHTGFIKALKKDKGFGFITCDKEDLFFHCSELEDSWETIEVGQTVDFSVTESKKGKIAVNIKSN